MSERDGAAPLHIGLLCSELFDAQVGGFGGFGFAAIRLAEVLRRADPDAVRFTAILPEPRAHGLPASVHGMPIVTTSGNLANDTRRFRALDVDVFIAIDWQPRYLVPLMAKPRTPVLLWIRDPRPASEWDLIFTVHKPGTEPPGPTPSEFHRRHRPTLQALLRTSRASGRRVEIAFPAIGLRPRFIEQYGVDPRRLWQLGTPLEPIEPVRPDGSDPFHVVLLGRLEAVKRPWIFWALAEARPDWRFTALGDVRPTSGWNPTTDPPNLTRVAHADAGVKAAVFADADVLVSCSIHEGLPVSVCEALGHGLAIASTTDVAGVVARFGEAVDNVPGHGLETVDPFVAGLDRLAADPERRRWIADAGPAWVGSIHARGPFLAQLSLLFDALGVPAGSALAQRVLADEPPPPAPVLEPAILSPYEGRRPDVLVIGSARAGTSELHERMRAHPGVAIIGPKEPRHFSSALHRPEHAGPHDERMVNERAVWSMSEYLARFAGIPEDRPAGEVSPLYLDTPGTAERIAVALPDVKLIAILRDPAERAHSQWRLHRTWGQEDLDFRAALDAEPRRLHAGWSPLYGYRSRGRYGALLRPFYEAVGPERILVLRFEDFAADADAVLAQIGDFLGVDGPWPFDANRGIRNATDGVPRSAWVAERLRGGAVPRGLKVLGPARGDQVRARLQSANRLEVLLDPRDRADLIAGYEADLRDLEALTGMDVASWRLGGLPAAP